VLPEEDADELDAGTAGSLKKRAHEIPWAKNPDWTWRLIDYLEQNPDFRRKLFSDATKDATADQRKKKQAKDQKAVAHGVLAEWVFSIENTDEALQSTYEADKAHYNKSVCGQLSR
jgi:hypothetical protein